jgi:hypothetical protein
MTNLPPKVILDTTDNNMKKATIKVPGLTNPISIESYIRPDKSSESLEKNEKLSIHWKYVKPLVNKAAIEKFETKNKISLPADLKQCIKVNNGGRPDKNTFDTDKSKERVFKTLLSFNENDVEKYLQIFFCYSF